jgi:putative endonuclease
MSHVVYVARGPRGALRIGRRGDGPRPVRSGRPLRVVYFELFRTAGDAIVRERQLKGWGRQWMVDLIETVNPRWDDLAPRLSDAGGDFSPGPTFA